MATPSKNDLAALGLVNRKPMHGYALTQSIQELGLEHWANLSTSSIYSALSRLAEKGAVSVTTEREGRAPERTVYHITPTGKEMLTDLLRQALSFVGPEDRLFYLGLTFAEGLPEAEIIEQLEIRLGRLAKGIDHMSEKVRSMKRESPEVGHLIAMIEGGRRHLDVEVWLCQHLIELLRSRPGYFAEQGGLVDG